MILAAREPGLRFRDHGDAGLAALLAGLVGLMGREVSVRER